MTARPHGVGKTIRPQGVGKTITMATLLALCAACGAAPAPGPTGLDSSNVHLVCGTGGPSSARHARTETNINLEREAVRCSWEGVEIPVFRREGDDRALFYRAPFKPIGPFEIDELADSSGRTVKFRLATRVPDLQAVCDTTDEGLRAALASAQPLPLDAVSLTLEEPVRSTSCTLRSPGMEHFFGAEEPVRLTLPDAAAAQRVLSALSARPTELALSVRYALHGLRRVPHCVVETGQLRRLDARAGANILRRGSAGVSIDVDGRRTSDATAVYVTGQGLRELRAELTESVRHSITSFDPHQCDPEIARRFAADTIEGWRQSIDTPEQFREALQHAVAAAGPDGDERALEDCRRHIERDIEAAASIRFPIFEASGRIRTTQGATDSPCTGGLELHRVVTSSIDTSALQRMTIQEYTSTGDAVEIMVRGGLCRETCGGCCSVTGDCILPSAQSEVACGSGEPGLSCRSCGARDVCGENACEPVPLDGLRFSVTLEIITVECIDGDGSQCDIAGSIRDGAALDERIRGGRNSNTAHPGLLLTEGDVTSIARSWTIRLVDLDAMFDDFLGTCEVRVGTDALQRAAMAWDGDERVAIRCGGRATVGLLVHSE